MPVHQPRDVYSVEKKGHVNVSAMPDSVSFGGDTAQQIIGAISALREEVAEMKSMIKMPPMADAVSGDEKTFLNDPEQAHDLELRLEVAQMVRNIAKAKSELAQIRHPATEDDCIEQASSELDAIVMATEKATNDILEATERIEKQLTQIAALAHEDEDIVTLCEKIASQTTAIMEACNFQDITGQRITKVVATMHFVEERIRSMIDIWGFDAFAELPVPVYQDGTEHDPDSGLLSGPQTEGKGISQAEIDALFD